MNKYEQTLSKFIPGTSTEVWSPIQFALMNAALEADRLTRRCSENAKLFAERLTTYAADLNTGRVWDPPTGSSLAYDITADHARLRAAVEHLTTLLGVTMGAEVRKAYIKALDQNFDK